MSHLNPGFAPYPTQEERTRLAEIERIYQQVESQLTRLQTSQITRVREWIITETAPHFSKIRSDLFSYLLMKMEGRAQRLGAAQLTRQAILRAVDRSSLSPEGIIPSELVGFKAHVKGMLGAFQDVWRVAA